MQVFLSLPSMFTVQLNRYNTGSNRYNRHVCLDGDLDAPSYRARPQYQGERVRHSIRQLFAVPVRSLLIIVLLLVGFLLVLVVMTVMLNLLLG